MEMEMVAADSIGIGEDVIPPLSPLSYALHDSFIHSHCASCFSPLPLLLNPLHPSSSHPFHRYCSPSCSSSHSQIHLHIHHLLRLSQSPSFNGETSDLRLALLLLLQIKHHQPLINDYNRIYGLMTNPQKILTSSEFSTRIKNGATAIASAMALDSDFSSNSSSNSSEEYLLEEAMLCLVITNSVEVNDKFGRSVGIALYDVTFSWINHSCSPNACYRFLPPESHGGAQRCLITPASFNSSNSTNSDVQFKEWREICNFGGPRIVVRSIKQINKGEQVTIAYTDLLQPKESRQLELWSKYMFTCCCNRCVAVPLTYADKCLQEISTSDGDSLHNVGIESFTEYIDDAIDDYLSSNDAESCCKKLENVLLNGFDNNSNDTNNNDDDDDDGKKVVIRLQPQHYLSLNAYTALASAYKVLAITTEDDNQLKMKRFSAAYSLLLALETHPLFLSESCLIASVSNYWISAGESLLNLSTSLSLESNSASDKPSSKCSRCGLNDMFEKTDDYKNVLDISNEFLNCCIASDVTHKVWKFLVCGNVFLEVVKNPVYLFESVGDNDMEGEERVVEVYKVGVHCLLYGGILSNVYGGRDSNPGCHVRCLLQLT